MKTFMAAMAIILFLTSTLPFLTSFAKADSALAMEKWVLISFPTPKVYNTSIVTLSFNNEAVASIFQDGTGPVVDYSNITYFLDGEMLGKVTPVVVLCRWSHTVNLTGLADGQHTIEVKGTVTATKDLYFCGLDARQGDHYDFSKNVTFTVYATPTPVPSPSPTQQPTFPTLPPLNDNTPTPPTSLTPSPSVPEFPNWVVLPILVAVAAVVVYFVKGKKQN